MQAIVILSIVIILVGIPVLAIGIPENPAVYPLLSLLAFYLGVIGILVCREFKRLHKRVDELAGRGATAPDESGGAS